MGQNFKQVTRIMKAYNFRLTLFDCAFVTASFVLLGVGLGIMALDGFDVWFAYLLALPTLGAVAKLRPAFRSAEPSKP